MDEEKGGTRYARLRRPDRLESGRGAARRNQRRGFSSRRLARRSAGARSDLFCRLIQIFSQKQLIGKYQRRQFPSALPLPSVTREGQPERSHLLAVANQQDVAHQYRVVPGLALDRLEPRQLRELVRGRPDKSQLSLLRQHQQQVLVGQQNELTVAVASALPLALAVLEVDAREDAAVEAEGMAFVNDEVVEVGLQPVRRPSRFDGPSAGAVCDPDAARAAVLAGDQDVAVRRQGRLHNSVARPRVLPEPLAVGQGDARRAGFAHQQDLLDSVDRQEMWRAVAPAAGRPEPAPRAGGEVIGDELARGGNDHNVADHQRRAREAPRRDLCAGVGRRIARPDDSAVTGVESVQDSGRAECVDVTVAEGRRRARTGAAIRLEEPCRVTVCPYRLAICRSVAGDDFVATALLLGVQEIAADGEGRPAWTDLPAP